MDEQQLAKAADELNKCRKQLEAQLFELEQEYRYKRDGIHTEAQVVVNASMDELAHWYQEEVAKTKMSHYAKLLEQAGIKLT